MKTALSLVFCMMAGAGAALAQADAKTLVTAAVQSELRANREDHTAFMYRDHDLTPEHDTVFQVVETPAGSLKKKLEDHGHGLSPEQKHVEDLRLHGLLNDANEQSKQRKDEVHDDEQAEQMLKMLPDAFVWTIKTETPELVTLTFKPDPNFQPKNMEARVMSGMAGEMVIARGDNRIRTLRGSLVDDVKIGYGLLGRLKSGGTFQVERREVAPHHWQITETHVHISGHVFFKTIGSQEDEVKTAFKLSPATTLVQAYELLETGEK